MKWPWQRNQAARDVQTSAPLSTPSTATVIYARQLQMLLEGIASGQSWGQLQGLMIGQGIDKDQLTQWIKQSGEAWLSQQDSQARIALQLLDLGQLAQGEFARAVSIVGNHWLTGNKSPQNENLSAGTIFAAATAKLATTNPE